MMYEYIQVGEESVTFARGTASLLLVILIDLFTPFGEMTYANVKKNIRRKRTA